MKNYESYVNSFLEYLDFELNYSNKTIITYKQNLKIYGKFLEDNKINFLKINKDIANKYKAYLINLGYQNKTSSLNLSTLRSFYNYLIEIRVLDINYFLNIHNPKVVKKLPNFLKDSEIKTILDNNNYTDIYTIRNEFIIEFLYATGLRVSELLSLKVNDLNSDGTIKVMGKGSKERIIYYTAMDKDLLNKYLDIRLEFSDIPNDYLIPGKKGKALSSRRVEELVKSYAEAKNIKNKITPHTLRHTYATGLLNNEADIRSVGELLGHSSLSTTQIYTHVTNSKLKEVYNKTHPRVK